MALTRKKPVYYYDECWQENFWFFLGWDGAEVLKFLSKKWNVDGLTFQGSGKAIEFQKPDGRRIIVIWLKKRPTNPQEIGTLAHECLHAAHMCLNHRCVQPSFENDEAVAYLMGTLMRKALEGKK